MVKTNYTNRRYYQNQQTLLLNPSKPFYKKRYKEKKFTFKKSLLLITIIFLSFIAYSASAAEFYCKHEDLVGFKGIPDRHLEVTHFKPVSFNVDTGNEKWNCEYPEGEDFLYCGDYFSQFVMQKITYDFTITYHNGLIKNAQDNLYVGYGKCSPVITVAADQVVG